MHVSYLCFVFIVSEASDKKGFMLINYAPESKKPRLRQSKVQEKKVKKIFDMNINPFKAVGNGGVTSSSGSSTPTPYLANGENADKSYHSLSNDFSFPPRGISSLYLPAVRGLRSLAVAYQEVPDGRKESSGSAWQFIGLMPLFDPPRHDSDQLAIAKETGRQLGMETNMYPSSALLGQHKDESIAALPVDELIEKVDGFAGVFPDICCFYYNLYCAWFYVTRPHMEVRFPTLIVLIIAILNDGTIMTISKDRVKPSHQTIWKLFEIFATGIILGSYLAMMTVIFFWAAYDTDIFPGAVDGSVFRTFWWPVMDSRCIICRNLVSNVREIFGSGHLLRKGGRVCLRI
ncbi:hypothetical protein LOK49_Contig242G00003 [Camellia lanceoleosa]|nr:hypothetical protein LOK49_Contig242G00003 [Camellia lanceoleosa]